jgi:hypothetical protein
MFYDQGCFGRVELGPLPPELAARLTQIPGEWLEFDPPTGAIVVRHVEPTGSRHLPAIACELVRLFSEIPAELHGEIPGGAFFVHTEDEHGQLIRLRVEPGGAIHIRWAHTEFKTATRRPYEGGGEVLIDPEVQQLDGTVSFESDDPSKASEAILDLADNFEGLYPEGDCTIKEGPGSAVELSMEEVNLGVGSLVDLLQQIAKPGTLKGRFRVSSFGTILPEQQLRFLFEAGVVWVQHPLLWPESTE